MGFILCIIYITFVWRKHFYGTNFLFDESANHYFVLIEYSKFSPGFPTDPGFNSLKFSAARHGVVFILFACLIYFVNLPALNTIALGLNLLYVFLAVYRQYLRRRQIQAEEAFESPVVPTLRLVSRATCAVAVYAVFLQVMLFVVYFFRP